ncbi:hypothetical protein XELAEV_18007764mg [Xenopus laevis]|uniref:Uncharacterized protein n=1 Tax=Xenopus laevis TaxID=8355 RepID=A0A974I5J0_XENLA|nr:hypothetical protein XELAEV_18007764mg [Xenopus laevis]
MHIVVQIIILIEGENTSTTHESPVQKQRACPFKESQEEMCKLFVWWKPWLERCHQSLAESQTQAKHEHKLAAL